LDFLEAQRENRRKIVLSLLFFVLTFLLVGGFIDFFIYSLGFPVFTLSALFISSIATISGYLWGDKILLNVLGAEPISRFNTLPFKRAMNVVDEISLAAGLPKPSVYVINEEFPNAMVIALSPEKANLCLTLGLIQSMTREELQGVIAHEFGHIKSRDSLFFLMLSVTWGAFLLVSDWFKSFYFREVRIKKVMKGPFFIIGMLVFLFLLLSPLISKLITMAISRWKEYKADAISAELTRNPLALAKAINKIMKYSSRMKILSRYYATAHIFIADPLRRDLSDKADFFSNLFNTHPPIKRRIEILARMAHHSPSDVFEKMPEKEPALCPECESEMKEVALQTSFGTFVKLDQCQRCGGIWFDAWELYALGSSPDYKQLNRPDIDKLWKKYPSGGKFLCPRCGIPLTRIQDRNLPEEINLRRCNFCGGIWLNYLDFKIYQEWRNEKTVKNAIEREVERFPSQILYHEKDFLDIITPLFSFLSKKVE